ncbi:hypothetical protein DERF_010324 [Dermatophagoides farinae]|uniref:Uncharacterized protein n=1 Tax=Dermatophagoides farinae TaxID=6954 RepID=A0A922L4W6_DERFA|nr:hypothetical protein DERF_010324 [Dermatophagoides farinae]
MIDDQVPSDMLYADNLAEHVHFVVVDIHRTATAPIVMPAMAAGPNSPNFQYLIDKSEPFR